MKYLKCVLLFIFLSIFNEVLLVEMKDRQILEVNYIEFINGSLRVCLPKIVWRDLDIPCGYTITQLVYPYNFISFTQQIDICIITLFLS